MKRSPLQRKTRLQAKPRRVDSTILDALARRSGGFCELAAHDQSAHQGHDPHHRKLRSKGGKDELVNLIWVCRAHHDAIHLSPALAYEKGWLVPGWADPAEVPWIP